MSKAPIRHDNTKYDINHLAPFDYETVQTATRNKPEIRTPIAVSFSWHCYTRSPEKDEQSKILKNKRGELRCFCPLRYELSHQLPEIIKQLSQRKISQTGKGNYVTVEIINQNGEKQEYEIYFTLRKQGSKQPLKLFVESAYIRDDIMRNIQQKVSRQSIGFSILVYKIKNSEKVPYKR